MNDQLLLRIAIALGVISLLLLLLNLRFITRVNHLIQNRFRHLLDISGSPAPDSGYSATLLHWAQRLGLQRLYAAGNVTLRTAIDRAGIYQPELRTLIHGGYILSPWLFAIAAAADSMIMDRTGGQTLMNFLWGAAMGYLTPRYLLGYLANLRRRRLSEETLIMIRLMQILFEAGLSIEQTLRTLRNRSSLLLPQMQHELTRIINRIDNGMDRATALDQWALEVGVEEIANLAEMLSQLSRQGGNIQKNLSDLVDRMEELNRTKLREKAGKLSGKMTVVMVLFLFPALMIFLAGPGVLSITAALGGLK